ncbi:acidic phospholipase A2 DE-II [Exaiptasia diaphana]|uniref:Phospholipase A2 n=1 Tax=Exaiptasia diaphana TaxID=2652724 RepID=A0A913XD55_EXADI|nr:acidic phospholipase A2 DE-II [Exaiptasia diaphana]KXJ26393.1 Phospholipase A2 [Exaiptasia diaphana]
MHCYKLGLEMLVIVLVAFHPGNGNPRHLKAEKGYLKSKFAAAHKRNLLQFGFMVSCATGRSSFEYNNYGNFCGYGGGGTPVDDIDRCCQEHDNCYGRNEDCAYYSLSYDSGYIKQYRTATQKCVLKCDDTEKCKFNICECDRIAAECFAKYRYNPKHKTYWYQYLWGRR